MTTSKEVISQALYEALVVGVRSASELTDKATAALEAKGFIVLAPTAIDGLEIAPPTPPVSALARAVAAYVYADGTADPADPFVPMASFMTEALAQLGFAVVPMQRNIGASITLPVDGLEPGYVTLPIDGWVDLEPEQKP